MLDWRKNLKVVLCSSAFSLGMLELGLRLVGFSDPRLFEPNPHTGSSHRAGAQGWWVTEGKAYIQINGAGFRDVEFEIARPPDTLRITVLGDSFT